MTTPLCSGPTAAALRVMSGDCRYLVLGDSTESTVVNGMLQARMKCWFPNKWVGIGGVWGGQAGSADSMINSVVYTQSFATGTVRDAADAAAPNSLSAWGFPFGAYHTFSGDAAPADASNIGAYRLAEFLCGPDSHYFCKDIWADGKPLTARYIFGTSDSGINVAPTILFRDQTGSNVTYTRSNNKTYLAEALGVAYTDITGAVRNYSTNGISIIVGITGVTPDSLNNLLHLGARFFTGEQGFELHVMSHAGYRMDDYVDTAKITDQQFEAYLQALDCTDIEIRLGINGSADVATYAAKAMALQARCRAALPNVHMRWVSPYPTANITRFSDYADALYAIHTADRNSSFLNLYKACGGGAGSAANYNFVNANYLSDGTHVSQPHGTEWIANKIWALTVALSVPGGAVGGFTNTFTMVM